MYNKLKNEILPKLLDELPGLSWEQRLIVIQNQEFHNKKVSFSTSFSCEDQVITHIISTNNLFISVFTIDTGRLFEETYKTFQLTKETYTNLLIDTYFPEAQAIQNLVRKQGINGFYESVANRLNCCSVRKVEPLQRALKDSNFWISGLRRDHSDNRKNLPIAEYDETRDIIKLYPLVDAGSDDITDYILNHKIPYNILYDKNFLSIGCAPCTRAINFGEQARAGRWWWENEQSQECGLHIKNGKLVRKGEK
jgi:phosphoadenosine phosphosulfate reductase